MVCKVFVLIVFFSLFKIHDCGELKVKVEDLFVDFVNYTYFDEETFHITIEYESETESYMDIRMDIIDDIPADVAVRLKVFGRAFGQYSVPTGINMDVKVCQGKLKEYLQPYIVAAGMAESCPPKRGTYESNTISTEMKGLPISLLPGLHLLVETETYSSNIVIMKVRSYVVVT